MSVIGCRFRGLASFFVGMASVLVWSLVMEWWARVGICWRLGIQFELQVGFPFGALLVFPYPTWIGFGWALFNGWSWSLFGQLLGRCSGSL